MKLKNTASKLGKVIVNGRNQLRGFATKSFDAIDNVRETVHPWLDKAEETLNHENVSKVRKLLGKADDLDPRIARLNLGTNYDMAVNQAKSAINMGQKRLKQLDNFMESDELKTIRQMTGTGLPRLPNIPNGHGKLRIPKHMMGKGVAPNQYGLSYHHSILN